MTIKKNFEKMEMTEITLHRGVKKIKLETSYINICNSQVILRVTLQRVKSLQALNSCRLVRVRFDSKEAGRNFDDRSF